MGKENKLCPFTLCRKNWDVAGIVFEVRDFGLAGVRDQIWSADVFSWKPLGCISFPDFALAHCKCGPSSPQKLLPCDQQHKNQGFFDALFLQTKQQRAYHTMLSGSDFFQSLNCSKQAEWCNQKVFTLYIYPRKFEYKPQRMISQGNSLKVRASTHPLAALTKTLQLHFLSVTATWRHWGVSY